MAGRPSPMPLPRQSWMESPTPCKDVPPSVFFPPDGHFLLIRQAVEICNTCPVQIICLEYALSHHIDDGVWGGTGRNERRRILRTRRSALRLAIDPEPPAGSSHG